MKNFLWIVIAVILVVIVGYNLYSGMTVQSIGIPGIFEIKFGQRPPPPEPTPTPEPPTPTPTPGPVPSTNLFHGFWENEDDETRGITKLEIEQSGAQLRVHAWGKCHPEDCDWGVEEGSLGINRIVNLTWDQGFVLRRMTIRLVNENRIEVITNSVYDDERPRQKSVEYFIKR